MDRDGGGWRCICTCTRWLWPVRSENQLGPRNMIGARETVGERRRRLDAAQRRQAGSASRLVLVL
jgi:hypothetical protein